MNIMLGMFMGDRSHFLDFWIMFIGYDWTDI